MNILVSFAEVMKQTIAHIESETGAKTFEQLVEWVKAHPTEQSPSPAIGQIENGSVNHG